MRAIKDRYGFLFWLQWILWFAASFVIAAVFWTLVMRWIFGRIAGTELTVTWVVCVFGSWFMLVIPFMRKKEQIWKRLNEDQERAVDAWFWGMGIFIGLLAASAMGWSLVFKDKILLELPGAFEPNWGKAVFASWLFFLIPFLIVMYRQADNIFKTAVQRQTFIPKYKSSFIESSKRQLPEQFVNRLKNLETTVPGGHLVEIRLKNGTKIPYVFIHNSREILGVYERGDLGFTVEDIDSFEVMDKNSLPAFDESKWLRVDQEPFLP